MTRRALSIRTRLTLVFVVTTALVLALVGVALYAVSERTNQTDAIDRINRVMAQVNGVASKRIVPGAGPLVLTAQNDVAVQVTNLADNRVWAASSTIAHYPVLSHEVVAVHSAYEFIIQLRDGVSRGPLRGQLSLGQAQLISTPRGQGYIVGFIYGSSVARANHRALISILIAGPLLLLVVGLVVWFAVGLTLSPVETIRRRVASIAASDLTERVPETGGDDEISRMAKTLNAMLNRLEASARLQQEFVSNASHELRSPLTTMLARADWASHHLEETDWRDFIDTIRREGRRIDSLVDDLFFLARNDEHRETMRHEEVDLDDILGEEARRLREMTALSVSTADVQPVRVWGDPGMLQRLVRNVVDNAQRFANREVSLSSCYVENMVEILVHDDGTGVDSAHSERLFQRFVRSDAARSRASGGTGLGLPIVAEIAQRHGGEAAFVDAASGTTIRIRVQRHECNREFCPANVEIQQAPTSSTGTSTF